MYSMIIIIIYVLIYFKHLFESPETPRGLPGGRGGNEKEMVVKQMKYI